FVTFGVIVVTIIGQGLVLPTVARSLGLSKAGLNERRHEQKVEIKVRRQALGIALKRLEKIIGRKKLPKDVVEHLRIRHVSRIGQLPDDMEDGLAHRRQTAELKQDLINVERDFIYELLRDGKITDEARRRIEYELDLEEASLANRRESDGGWL
ncbi:MAG: Na+/H+ antiporter, partial [Pseudolabrys sp.]|nr:Na+/H+ antiporter [Pseudolabrys sp.]